MRAPTSFSSHLPEVSLQAFPTRGVPGGWRDPWDDDPRDPLLARLPRRGGLQRHIIAGSLELDLVAEPRTDGRWEAHVTSSFIQPDERLAPWPSVNGPAAMVALDALEAEVRDILQR